MSSHALPTFKLNVCTFKGQRPGMPPVLGIHSRTRSLIHGTRPGTSAYHSPTSQPYRRHCLYIYVCMITSVGVGACGGLGVCVRRWGVVGGAVGLGLGARALVAAVAWGRWTRFAAAFVRCPLKPQCPPPASLSESLSHHVPSRSAVLTRASVAVAATCHAILVLHLAGQHLLTRCQ